MKILLINARYAYVGGPERYMLNLRDLLTSQGHEVIPFSVAHPDNEPSPYTSYFASPLSKNEAIYYKDQDKSLTTQVRTLRRNFYSTEVEHKLKQLIHDHRPDFAIVLLYLRKLSPAVLTALHSTGTPFAVRLSDFGMICAGANFYRDGKVCELCLHGNAFNSVLHRCAHNSFGASLVNYLAGRYHKAKNFFDLIPAYIATTAFTRDKFIEAGYPAEKFTVIPTFARKETSEPGKKIPGRIVYAGRIEPVKGLDTLADAVAELKSRRNCPQFHLVIAGNGNPDYVPALKKKLTAVLGGEKVTFAGNLPKQELIELFKSAQFSVIPSRWYDNLPNAALESFACGTPVLASAHGCFTELVEGNNAGLLFIPGDAVSMADKMQELLNHPEKTAWFGAQAVKAIETKYAASQHYQKLMQLIDKLRHDDA